METARQIVAFGMLAILLCGGISTIVTKDGGYLAGAIVMAVFISLFLIFTVDCSEEDNG
jgi:hypothetical protein